MPSTPPPPRERMIGQLAPPFALPDQEGTMHRLEDDRGKWVVLYFYPKDDTPGCTAEACGFRDSSGDFAALGAVILGISVLGVKSKAKFAARHALNFPLLADEDHAVAGAYGVWVGKSMYGKKYMGISRETFIIDPDGKVAAHWPKVVANTDHAGQVLDWLRRAAAKGRAVTCPGRDCTPRPGHGTTGTIDGPTRGRSGRDS